MVGTGSSSAHLCEAWCWVLRGLGALVCFAPFAWVALRVLPRPAAAHCAMVLAQVIFGAGTVLVGGDMKQAPIDPVVFALVREALAGLVLGAAAAATDRRVPWLRDLPRIWATGMAVWATNLLFAFGVQWVSKANEASVATLMQPCLPVVTTLMAILLRFERAGAAKIGGIALAIGGSSLVVALGEREEQRAHAHASSGGASSSGGGSGDDGSSLLMMGILALLAQAFANASYILLQRKLLQPAEHRPAYPVLSLTAWGFLVAAVCMAAFSAITPGWDRRHDAPTGATGSASGEAQATAAWDVPNAIWLPVVYWVFGGSCVGYSCCSLANSVLPASVIASYVCLQPLVGVIFSYILLGEKLAWHDAGGCMIVVGLLVTTLGARSETGVDEGQGDTKDSLDSTKNLKQPLIMRVQ